MRAIWSGAITFGLVNVPVKVYSATQDHDLDLHQVHAADGGQIRYQRRCEVCGKVVAYKDIDKAFTKDGKTVMLTDQDIKGLPAEQTHEIDVVEFVPSDQIDPIRLDRSYFLEPTSKSTKAYTLLRRVLHETERTAVAQFSLRQRTRLAVLRVYGSTILLQTLLWDDEVREADFPVLEKKPRISAKELELAQQIVSSMETDFRSDQFSDEYQVQLRELVEQKLSSGDSVEATTSQPQEADSSGEVIDLMDALRKSIEKNRSTTARASKSPKKKPASPRKKTG